MALRRAPRWAVASLIFVVVVMAGLVAIGARQLPGGEIRPPPFLLQVDPAEVVTWVFIVLVAAGGALLLYLALTAARRPGSRSRRKTMSPIATLAALIVMAALILFGPIDRIREALSVIIPDGAESSIRVVGWSRPGGSRACGVAVVGGGPGGGGGSGRSGGDRHLETGRQPPTTGREGATDEVVEDAVGEALAALRLGDDPRSAVLRAYAAMEQTLAEAGWGRRILGGAGRIPIPGLAAARLRDRCRAHPDPGISRGPDSGGVPSPQADRSAADDALVEVRARVVQQT